MHVTIDGNDCILSPCVDSNDEYIIYDGINFSTSADAAVPEFAKDLIRQYYYENPYSITDGTLKVVTPPVDVPIWVGGYRQDRSEPPQ